MLVEAGRLPDPDVSMVDGVRVALSDGYGWFVGSQGMSADPGSRLLPGTTHRVASQFAALQLD